MILHLHIMLNTINLTEGKKKSAISSAISGEIIVNYLAKQLP